MGALTRVAAAFEAFRFGAEMAQLFHRSLDLSRKLVPFFWAERNFPYDPRDLHFGAIQGT
jgi:hypothetical protein